MVTRVPRSGSGTSGSGGSEITPTLEDISGGSSAVQSRHAPSTSGAAAAGHDHLATEQVWCPVQLQFQVGDQGVAAAPAAQRPQQVRVGVGVAAQPGPVQR